MREYITKAFEALEDLDISVDDIVLTEEEESSDNKTILDLITEDSSYNIIHDVEIDGMPFSLYIECTCDGESCDATFGEFDVDNIDGLIVDLLDADRNFVSTVNGVSLDTTIAEAKKLAVEGQGEKELVKPSEETVETTSEEEEEPESNERVFLGGTEEEVEEGLTEGKNLTVNVSGDVNVETGDVSANKEKNCECEEDKNADELTESKAFDLNDREDVEKAKDELEKVESEEPIEQIVDVSAETVDDLKKTYIGSVILQCPTCKTMVYKNPDELVKSDDDEIYNIEDECPHCGAKDGFEIVGQVATLDTNPESENEAPMEEPTEDVELEVETTEEETPEENKPTSIEEPEVDEEGDNVTFESLDEEMFDKLIKRYLHETYFNIKDYATTSAYVDNSKNTIILEGRLTFKSGSEKPTRFIFEAKELTKRGKVKFVGLNETFSDKRAFTLSCCVNENKLLSENLSYNYKINEMKVTGKVSLSKKR